VCIDAQGRARRPPREVIDAVKPWFSPTTP
jgi:hypothetical protein